MQFKIFETVFTLMPQTFDEEVSLLPASEFENKPIFIFPELYDKDGKFAGFDFDSQRELVGWTIGLVESALVDINLACIVNEKTKEKEFVEKKSKEARHLVKICINEQVYGKANRIFPATTEDGYFIPYMYPHFDENSKDERHVDYIIVYSKALMYSLIPIADV